MGNSLGSEGSGSDEGETVERGRKKRSKKRKHRSDDEASTSEKKHMKLNTPDFL